MTTPVALGGIPAARAGRPSSRPAASRRAMAPAGVGRHLLPPPQGPLDLRQGEPAAAGRKASLRRRLPAPVRAEATPAVASKSTKSRTQEIMEEIDARESNAQSSGAGGGTTWANLQRMEGVWEGIRTMKTGEAAGPAPEFVKVAVGPAGAAEYDVLMAGGTLGIFAACALQLKGIRVAVIERGELRGRTQEWNISRKEMEEFVEHGVITGAELEQCITSEFNPIRSGFDGGKEIWVENILNLGVQPAKLVEIVRARFEGAGGTVLERTGLAGVTTHPDAVVAALEYGPGGAPVGAPAAASGRLLIDCMGFASPAVRQARWGTKPDGVCLVVGCLGRGFEDNTHGDLIFTDGPLHPELPMQYFWEAFPAGSGPTDRTTYMFTYIDADESRPSFEQLLEDYWDLMPKYQGVELSDIEVQRVLYGFFATYRDSPLPAQWDRVIQIGDASGIQSPLSFGGFGAMARHMDRILSGVEDALEADALDRASLAKLNPYQPNLSSSWLFQKAMSVPAGSVGPKRPKDDGVINGLLATNFEVMEELGPSVLRPFLQDVVQFGPLGQAMVGMMIKDPLSIPPLLLRLGPGPVADWFGHFAATGAYTVAHAAAEAAGLRGVAQRLPPRAKFEVNRALDAVKFGSGMDYH